ncbi:hypothetical protein [Streptomyces sp. NRRL F-2664]|uniref:hypothetical protein n=1 Tax=Streptomyces sp. NRRL F-2664 TaxID=1463842 RepID=UPI0004C505D0|nr:hypothetical protein [Streptomyces sp. NRRL F-2664]
MDHRKAERNGAGTAGLPAAPVLARSYEATLHETLSTGVTASVEAWHVRRSHGDGRRRGAAAVRTLVVPR